MEYKDALSKLINQYGLDVLKDKYICTYYHDDFSDIILKC